VVSLPSSSHTAAQPCCLTQAEHGYQPNQSTQASTWAFSLSPHPLWHTVTVGNYNPRQLSNGSHLATALRCPTATNCNSSDTDTNTEGLLLTTACCLVLRSAAFSGLQQRQTTCRLLMW
jgi:hypothetical protein